MGKGDPNRQHQGGMSRARTFHNCRYTNGGNDRCWPIASFRGDVMNIVGIKPLLVAMQA
jgi:hypothetical protein